MNHKYKKSRDQRAGCKLCKPWKILHAKDKRPFNEQKTRPEIDE